MFAWGFSNVNVFRFPSEGTGFRGADLVGKHHPLEALHSIGALVHAARSSGTVPGVGGNIVERYPFLARAGELTLPALVDQYCNFSRHTKLPLRPKQRL